MESARGRGVTRFLRNGIAAALVTLVLDQASKFWLLYIFEIERKGAVSVTPFFDLVIAWNTGISYGLFQSEGMLGQIILLAIKVGAVVALGIWLYRAQSHLVAVSLGLIIGGAFGNGIDRLIHGAVVDFVLLHAQIGGKTFNWYVFNLADMAIVAGVAGLLYDTLFAGSAQKAP
jgi:signal peptidase II